MNNKKIKRVYRLHKARVSHKKIAKQYRVSIESIGDYIKKQEEMISTNRNVGVIMSHIMLQPNDGFGEKVSRAIVEGLRKIK